MQIAISSFKCFEELIVNLGSLTLFTGFNGAGKSSVIQSLLLLSQSLRGAPTGGLIDLDGPLVHLGNATDVARLDGRSPISFMVAEGDVSARWEMAADRRARHLRVEEVAFAANGSSMSAGQIAAPTDHPAAALCDTIRDLTFLGASRLFSTTAWPSPPMATPYGDVGRTGEFAPYWHFQIADDEVLEARRHKAESRTTVRGQTDAYLNQLFPGAAANTDQLVASDLYRLDLRLGTSGWVRPGNIGFGLTYVFPLIVALLAARNNQIVIVDSPEAHLHPRAQSELGKIVARFAASGVRVIVETHSDHFLNGVRIAVQEMTIAPREAAVYFFGGASDEGHGVVQLNIDSDGNIDRWPSGFFDQAESDLGQLLGFPK